MRYDKIVRRVVVAAIVVVFVGMAFYYSALWLDDNDPIAVTQYYFEQVMHGEWFLVYRVYDKELFDSSRQRQIREDYDRYYLALVKKIEGSIVSRNDKEILVESTFFYDTLPSVTSYVSLGRKGSRWVVENVTYQP